MMITKDTLKVSILLAAFIIVGMVLDGIATITNNSAVHIFAISLLIGPFLAGSILLLATPRSTDRAMRLLRAVLTILCLGGLVVSVSVLLH